MGMRDWSELHIDLLLLIFEHLPFIDLIRTKAVCSSWYSASQASPASFRSRFTDNALRQQVPWLMLDTGDHAEDTGNYTTFFDPEEKNLCKIKLNMPQTEKKEFYSKEASNGWLVLSDDSALYLLNPFTGSCAEFPLNRQDETCIHCPLLWIDDYQKGYRPVLVKVGCRAVFCRLEVNRWFDELAGYNPCIGRQVFYKDDKLYAFDSFCSLMQVWDSHGNKADQMNNLGDSLPFLSENPILTKLLMYRTQAVMTPSGDILMVATFYNQDGFIDLFLVYKLDLHQKRWQEVRSLEDHILFIGEKHNSVAVLARDVKGCKGNSIYFHERMTTLGQQPPTVRVGIFNLEDQKVETLSTFHLQSGSYQQPLWITPTLAEI